MQRIASALGLAQRAVVVAGNPVLRIPCAPVAAARYGSKELSATVEKMIGSFPRSKILQIIKHGPDRVENIKTR